MSSISGWSGRITLPGPGIPAPNVHLAAVRWTVTVSNELVDITHVGDGVDSTITNAVTPAALNTLKSYEAGYTDIAVSVDCIWDSDTQPFTTSTLSVPVNVGSTMKADLYIDRSDSKARFSLFLIVETITVEDEVRGVAKWSFTAKQSGYLGGASSTNIKVPGFTS